MTTLTFEPMTKHPLTGSIILQMSAEKWGEYYTYLKDIGLSALTYRLAHYRTLKLYHLWELKV